MKMWGRYADTWLLRSPGLWLLLKSKRGCKHRFVHEVGAAAHLAEFHRADDLRSLVTVLPVAGSLGGDHQVICRAA